MNHVDLSIGLVQVGFGFVNFRSCYFRITVLRIHFGSGHLRVGSVGAGLVRVPVDRAGHERYFWNFFIDQIFHYSDFFFKSFTIHSIFQGKKQRNWWKIETKCLQINKLKTFG